MPSFPAGTSPKPVVFQWEYASCYGCRLAIPVMSVYRVSLHLTVSGVKCPLCAICQLKEASCKFT